MKPKVLAIFPKIHEAALKTLSSRLTVSHWRENLPPSADKVAELASECTGILIDSATTVDRKLLDSAKNLKVVSTLTVGLDHIDVDECRTRAPVVANEEPSPWDYAKLLGDGIEGSTVGIFGMGRIGLATAQRIAAFRPKAILYHNRRRKADLETQVNPNAEYVSFGKLLELSDIVIATCALTPETTGAFDRKAFETMKTGSYFVNASRGKVVDQEALQWALSTGKLNGAGLDVTDPEPLSADHPLHKIPNLGYIGYMQRLADWPIKQRGNQRRRALLYSLPGAVSVILPHLGTSTRQALAKMIETACQNLVAGIFGEKMIYEVGIN